MPDIRRGPQAFPVLSAADLPEPDPARRFLIDPIYSPGVGLIGGVPKSFKTWLGLEIAVSLASGTPFLGRFDVPTAGKVLVFVAEDPQNQVRERLRLLAGARGLGLADLNDVRILNTPGLMLDDGHDALSLEETIKAEKPMLLILDPFVRVFGGSENDAISVARVLGRLRRLQREYNTSILVAHHYRKNLTRGVGGHSLRGSGDFHAWADSSMFLQKRDDFSVNIIVEHRSARAPEPFVMRAREEDGAMRLVVDDGAAVNAGEPEVDEEDAVVQAVENVVGVLQEVGGRITRTALRKRLGIQNEALGRYLVLLEDEGRIERDSRGVMLIEPPPLDD